MLCVTAVFTYDRLLMPGCYWSAFPAEQRQGRVFADLLRQKMMDAWADNFIPATCLFVVGLLIVLMQHGPMPAVLEIELPVAGRVAVFGSAVLLPVVWGVIRQARIYAGRSARGDECEL